MIRLAAAVAGLTAAAAAALAAQPAPNRGAEVYRRVCVSFLADPDALVPGSEMSLPPLSAADRQAVAAWLQPR